MPISAPGTVSSPVPDVEITAPQTAPPTLPDLPSPDDGASLPTVPFVRRQDGAIIAMHQDPVTRAWTTSRPIPTIGPSSDPDVPHLLAEIDYKPITAPRLDAPIPIIYGRTKVGGNPYRMRKWGSELMVVPIWGEGEIDAVEAVLSGSNDITLFTQVAAYTGTATQTGDPSILSLYGQADDLPGVAYSVLQLRPVDSLDLSAIIRGKKVFDPRSGLTAWSANAALCLADFIANYTVWAVDWSSVAAAADYCDVEIAIGIKRWEVNMPLADRKEPDEWVAILAEYANCYVFIDGGVARLLPDEARAVDHVLTGGDIVQGTFDLQKSGQRDTPTQVFCQYTLIPASGEWTEDVAFTPDPPIEQPLRITNLRMLGFQHKIQAERKAIQFQNYANLADLWCNFRMFDRGAKITKGDVISITHPVGLAAKEFRVLNAAPVSRGRWQIEAREYSALVYSDAVVADPDVSDTPLPAVNEVPTPQNMVLAEVLYQIAPGETRSRLEASVDAVVYPFQHVYEWQVLEGATEIHTAVTTVPRLKWGPLPIAGGITYTVRVLVRGPVGPGDAQAKNITIQGKLARPLPPTSFSVFEAQGIVFFRWAAAVDIDLRGYEIRFGATATPWEDMIPVNRWGLALAGQNELIPLGTWDFEIRSFDSVRTAAEPQGQYSATGLRASTPVTSDAASFHVADHSLTFDALDSSNIIEINGSYWSDFGQSWLDVFGTDPLAAKTNPLISYLEDPPYSISEWVSEALDIGQVLSVTAIVTPAAEAIVGTVTTTLQYRSDVLDPWTDAIGTSAKITGRYFRVKYTATGSSRMRVGPDDYGLLTLDVIASELRGDFTTDGIGPVTVDVGRPVSKFTFISVTVPGTANRAFYDNVTTGNPGTFDVSVLDALNNHVADTGFWLANFF